jgi:hypothetical protein
MRHNLHDTQKLSPQRLFRGIQKHFMKGMMLAAIMLLSLSVNAATIPCASMTLSASSVPPGNYTVINIAPGGSTTISALADAVTDVRIIPTVFINPADNAVCGVDYSADLTAGTATLTFIAPQSYFVRITRASSAVEELVIRVGLRSQLGCKVGVAKEFDCGTQDVAIVSTGASDYTTAFSPGGKLAGGLQAAIDSICAAYAANGNMPVSVALVGHGSPGQVIIGSDTLKGAQVDSFVAKLKGKVSSLVLFSCSAADGVAGSEFVCKLEQGLGVDVTGSTGAVDGQGNPPNVKWSTQGEMTSWEPPLIPFMIPELPPFGIFCSPPFVYTEYTNGIRIRNVWHDQFLNQGPPPSLGNTQIYTTPSRIIMEVSTDGGLTWSNDTVMAPFQVRATHIQDVGIKEIFETEILQMDLVGGSLPVGVMLRESPTKNSLGELTITPGGTLFFMDSFFDVWTEISLDGGTTWSPTTNGPTTMYLLSNPSTAGIPTLGEWGLIALAILLVISGSIMMRNVS